MSENNLKLSNGDEQTDGEGGLAVAPVKPELQKPSKYRVLMLNDDYTPMDFVIEVLKKFFGMDMEKATQVMLAVHTQGSAVCGIFSKDIAETKAAVVVQYARDHQHPLMCDVEKVS